MRLRFNPLYPVTIALYGLIVLLAGVVLWWQFVYLSPRYAFNDMLDLNLSTTSVTKNQLASSNSQVSLQRINMQFGVQNTVRSVATVRSAAGSVTTETIGKPGVAYVRYTNISDAGKSHKYTNVVNVWAKASQTSSNTPTGLFTQSVLDVTAAPTLPVGFVEQGQRANMLTYIKDEKVFTADYTKVATKTINGRAAYEYPVSVKLAPYLRLMQQYAHTYGLKDLDQLSPSDYQSAAPVKITVAVDKVSHQMLRVTLPSSGFNETYTDQGIFKPIATPTTTISADALQQRLNAIK
jgi:hypothetical protein